MNHSAAKSPDVQFANVALPISLEEPLTYSVPLSLQHRVRIGMRALVPVQKRLETGYIVGLSDRSDVEKTREIADLPDNEALFSDQMIALCRWIADYYCCSIGEAMHCAVPAGIRIRSKLRYTLLPDQLSAGRYTDRQRAAIAALHRRGPMTESQLAKEVGQSALSNTLQSLLRRGLVLAEPIATDAGTSLKTETWVVLNGTALDGEAQAALQRRAPKQAAVYLDMLHRSEAVTATELYERHGVNSTALKTLEEKGLIRREERESYRAPEVHADHASKTKLPLNAEQQSAFDRIACAMESNLFHSFLIKGITGSGKTEVYLQAIERALALGKDAIILVPEISLTPQTVGRFKARFEDAIAVLHSGLAPGERYDEWRRALRGEVRIVVGARSAVFAPLPNLGIVVVDEEHDTSYKQNESPRYHARDVAIMRTSLAGAVCVLGSATPSIESYHNSETGKSERLELRSRATSAPLPEVRLIDMRAEVRATAGDTPISRTLEEAIAVRLAEGEQVILLLNRRGHSPFVLCPKCGWVAQCKDCHVSLTYHAKGAYLSCHYCNAHRRKPEVCDECHFNPLLYLGHGTQKIEDYLERSFPNARIARMDRDTTAGRGGHAKILGRFAKGEIDLLVGTQMIAKGHDYPGVTLVGVVNADTGLALPDFRAAEQVFQLMTQVAGRAGRGEKPGEVLIQTYRPNHYAIQAAAKHDYAAFYAQEIAHRERAQYPPFRRLVNFMVEAASPEEAEREAQRLHRIAREKIAELNYPGIQLLGPSPATIQKLKKKFRWNLGAFSKSAKRLNTLVRAVRPAFAEGAGRGVALKVDLDPYGMF